MLGLLGTPPPQTSPVGPSGVPVTGALKGKGGGSGKRARTPPPAEAISPQPMPPILQVQGRVQRFAEYFKLGGNSAHRVRQCQDVCWTGVRLHGLVQRISLNCVLVCNSPQMQYSVQGRYDQALHCWGGIAAMLHG